LDSTISRVEQVIMECEGLAIDKVQAPRQKLEQLFMDIVERARNEQVATSGALDGGVTAAFLRAQTAQGEELIASLSSEEQAPSRPRARAVEVGAARKEPAAVRDDVLAKLVGDGDRQVKPVRVREAAAVPKPPDDVDSSVIDSLLSGAAADDETESEKSSKSRRPPNSPGGP